MKPETNRRRRIDDILVKFLILEGLVLLAIAGWSFAQQYRASAALASHESEDGILLAVTAEDIAERQLPLARDDKLASSASETGPADQSPLTDDSVGQGSPEVAKSSKVGAPYLPSFEDQGTAETPAEAPPAAETSKVEPATPDRIVAPAIGLDAEVVPMGWEVVQRNGETISEWVIPDDAAGWHKNSARPGTGGNTVLSGHNNIAGEVFRYLENLEVGDEITLYAGEQMFSYVVEEKYIVREKGMPEEVRRRNAQWRCPEPAEGMLPTEDERLTGGVPPTISCWPYWTNTHRIIIVARPDQSADPASNGRLTAR